MGVTSVNEPSVCPTSLNIYLVPPITHITNQCQIQVDIAITSIPSIKTIFKDDS